MKLSRTPAYIGGPIDRGAPCYGEDNAWVLTELLGMPLLLVCRIPYYARMGEVLGLEPRWTITLPAHGRKSGIGIIEAATALAAGQCNYAALLYSNIGRSRRVNYGGEENPGVWDPWGFTSPGAAHALMFRRHMELYGTTTRQLAEVSVAIRHHATLNPGAVMRMPITIEDHEASRFIAEPLRLLGYCLINDGAVCLTLTTAERARDCAQTPSVGVRLRHTGNVPRLVHPQFRYRLLV